MRVFRYSSGVQGRECGGRCLEYVDRFRVSRRSNRPPGLRVPAGYFSAPSFTQYPSSRSEYVAAAQMFLPRGPAPLPAHVSDRETLSFLTGAALVGVITKTPRFRERGREGLRSNEVGWVEKKPAQPLGIAA